VQSPSRSPLLRALPSGLLHDADTVSVTVAKMVVVAIGSVKIFVSVTVAIVVVDAISVVVTVAVEVVSALMVNASCVIVTWSCHVTSVPAASFVKEWCFFSVRLKGEGEPFCIRHRGGNHRVGIRKRCACHVRAVETPLSNSACKLSQI
jgi:hypothetical protein